MWRNINHQYEEIDSELKWLNHYIATGEVECVEDCAKNIIDSCKAILENIEHFLRYTVEICTILMEFFGIIVLVFTAIKCFVGWIKHDSNLRLNLAQGIAVALEFKMGGEVLRTVIVREWTELGILGAII